MIIYHEYLFLNNADLLWTYLLSVVLSTKESCLNLIVNRLSSILRLRLSVESDIHLDFHLLLASITTNPRYTEHDLKLVSGICMKKETKICLFSFLPRHKQRYRKWRQTISFCDIILRFFPLFRSFAFCAGDPLYF